MNWYKRAQEINVLNGKSNDSARRMVRNIVLKALEGRTIFSDTYWEGPQIVFRALKDANIDWQLTGSKYGVSPSHQQMFPDKILPNDYKEWYIEIKFVNKNNRPTLLKGTLIAMGAGSVEDPLSKYDLTFII